MKHYYLLFALTTLFTGLTFAQTYEPSFLFDIGTGFNSEVNIMKIDGNGRLVVGGNFTSYDGTTISYLIRLNADGTADNGYGASLNGGPAGPQLSSAATDLTIHSDNSITVVTAGGLTRFGSSGSLTLPSGGAGTWTPNSVITVAAESTGTDVIVGGNFTDESNRIIKLNSNNLPDATFLTNIGTGFNDRVRTIEITATGKILVGGDFTSFNGTTRNHIALLNSDGSLDTSFDPGSTLSSDVVGVYAVAMQADGKILAGSSPSSAKVVRFNTDGTVDTGFNGLIENIASVVSSIYTNGTDDIVVGGWFSDGIARLDYNTGISTSIAAGNGIEGSSKEANTLAIDSEGQIFLAGSFTSYNGFAKNNIVGLAICHVSIDTQPTSSSTCEGEAASFTVSASGGSTFQWQVNTNSGIGLFNDISNDGTYSGTATNSLNLSNATSGMNNYVYRCVVTDTDAMMPTDCYSTTDPAILTVNAAQVLTADPVNDDVCAGFSASFSVSYTGTIGGFQWQEDPGTGVFADLSNGGIYSNVNQSTLSISSTTKAMDGYKYRMVSSLCTSGYTTTSATLSVSEAPVVTQSSANVEICVSGDATLSVAATSNSSITYQWQYTTTGHSTAFYTDLSDNATYSGVNTANLTITDADNTLPELYDNTGDVVSARFRCKVTSNGCQANSISSFLTIHDTPTDVGGSDFPTLCDTGSGINTTIQAVTSTNISTYNWQVDEGSGFHNLVDDEIYTGSAAATLQFAGATSALNGNQYRCQLGFCASPVYTPTVTIQIDNAPVITQHPQTSQVCEGTDTEFEVTATGDNLTYQWQRRPATSGTFADIVDNASYSGTSDFKLLITEPTVSMNGDVFRCVVSSGSCSVNSNTPQLRVYAPPSFSSTLNDRTVCEGSSVVFSKPATGFNALAHTYQWQVALPGFDIFTDLVESEKYTINGYALTVMNPTINMNGNRYRLSIDGCASEAVSDDATLTVLGTPIFSASPLPQTVCAGEITTFTAEATGEGIFYQWYRDDGNGYVAMTSLQTNPEYKFSTPASYNGNKFKCVASAPSPCHTTLKTESFEATLTVNDVEFSAEPESTTVCWGESATFIAGATTTGITYQWLQSGQVIEESEDYTGTQSNTLTVKNVTSDISGYYYQCRLSGLCEDNTSNPAYLTVNGGDKPIIKASGEFDTNDLYLSTDYIVAGYDTFQWSFNGEVVQEFANNPSISADKVGRYTVIRKSNECISESSDAYIVEEGAGENPTVTHVANLQNLEFKVFPNPVTNSLNLQFDKSNNSSIKLLSMDGKVVKEFQSQKGEKASFNVSDVHPGLYLIQVTFDENKQLRKIIIK